MLSVVQLFSHFVFIFSSSSPEFTMKPSSNQQDKAFIHKNEYKWMALKSISRTNGQISSYLDTKYPFVNEIMICSNNVPCPFLRGDNDDTVKIQ